MNMGNIHLVTGYAGQQHVTAADQAAFNAALLGSGQFVLPKGNQLSASIVTNNQVRVLDGDICMQGRHIRLNEGSYVDLAIENGTQDHMRNDLIVVRYTKDAGAGVEEANLVVIKGTAVASNPSDPAYTVGDLIEDHDILNDMPLYRVPLNGINVQKLVPLFTVSNPAILDKQDKTDKLTAETSLADADYIPFYDTSATSNRKVLWSRIKTILGNVFAAKTHSHAISEVTNLQTTLNNMSTATNGKAPAIQYGTADVTAGSASSYPEGTLYVVVE